MAGSAIEAASTSSDCLSGEDSEPPPGQGSPTYRLSQDLIHKLSQAHSQSQRPRNLRLQSKADVQPKLGAPFAGVANSSRVQKRTNQQPRQRELPLKRKTSCPTPNAFNVSQKGAPGKPYRTFANHCSTKAEEGSHSKNARAPPSTPKTATPASLRTALSTPSDFSPAWSYAAHEACSSDGDDHSVSGGLPHDWEMTDPVARGLREEIQRVRREKENKLERVREIRTELEKLGKMTGKQG
ncbi:MAG: hypothetical protein MMC23_000378 [Stictis urceolatum]|nr:hypothetical protein [Stictis urceolata]